MSLILISNGFLTTAKTTSTTGSNKTNLLTRNGIPFASRGVTNVLVITTTVRVLNGVHSNTTNDGEVVTLGLVFVVSTTSLKHRLLATTTTGNNTDGTTSGTEDTLFHTRWHTDASFTGFGIVGHNGAVITRSTGDFTSVSRLFFYVGDDATFGKVSDRDDVSDLKGSFFTAIDELTGVSTFSSDEVFFDLFKFVRVAEDDLSDGSSTSRIVNDLSDDAFDIAVFFGVV